MGTTELEAGRDGGSPSPSDAEKSTTRLAATSRRRVLGVLGAGVLVGACSNGADLTSQAPAPGGATTSTLGGAVADTTPPAAIRPVPLAVETAAPVNGVAAPGGNTAGLSLPVKVEADGTTTSAPAPTTQPDTPSTAAGSDSDSTTGTPATTASGDGSTSTSAAPATSATTAPAAGGGESPVLVVEAPGAAETTTSTAPPEAPATAAPPSAPSLPSSSNAAVDLVISRLTFGPTPDLRERVQVMGVNAFIDDQLSKTSSSAATDRRLSGFTIWNRFGNQNEDLSRVEMQRPFDAINVIRGVESDHQLFEIMSLFWGDHFNVWNGESRVGHLTWDYQEKSIRPRAMGTFRELLRAVIEGPSMLLYLDNATSNPNSRQGFNENLGREVLELHTLGIDENDNQIYSLDDVQSAAKALAGWSTQTRRGQPGWGEFNFRDDYAYRDGTISLLGGAWTSDGLSGKAVGNSMLDFLATHPQTARYISYKLCRRFVADEPPLSLVDSTARVFLANDTAIVPTLRHIFSSDEFAASGSQKFRRPMEAVYGILRALQLELPADPDDRTTRGVSTNLLEMGHQAWEWLTPDGYPDTAFHWLTGPGLLSRWNYGALLARQADPQRYRPSAATVGELIDKLAIQFGLGSLPADDRQAAAAGVGASPDDAVSEINEREFAELSALLLSHPLFHVR